MNDKKMRIQQGDARRYMSKSNFGLAVKWYNQGSMNSENANG